MEQHDPEELDEGLMGDLLDNFITPETHNSIQTVTPMTEHSIQASRLKLLCEALSSCTLRVGWQASKSMPNYGDVTLTFKYQTRPEVDWRQYGDSGADCEPNVNNTITNNNPQQDHNNNSDIMKPKFSSSKVKWLIGREHVCLRHGGEMSC